MKKNFLVSAVFLGLLAISCDGGGGSSDSGDPLFEFQWHLINTGQKNFAQNGGTAGADINYQQTVADGFTGKGVIASVVDSDMQTDHPDLEANSVPGGSYNYTDGSDYPVDDGTSGHGTSVAGVIGAVGDNGLGGRGVASHVSLQGFNPLIESQYVDALGGNARSQDTDIFNMSFGDDSNSYVPLATVFEDLYDGSQSLRDGKGVIYVKAAGNGYLSFQPSDATASMQVSEDGFYYCSEQSYYLDGVTCQNDTGEGETSHYVMIVVAALNANGTAATYSTAGSTTWIAAPAGEFGEENPATMTVDLTNCTRGRSKEGADENSFQFGNTTYNPDCNYTSIFNGTSSAAPVIVGAVALILEANPNLTRREVKDILARTAVKVQDEISASALTTLIDGVEYIARLPWIENAAGFNFHNWYGFGAVDVDAAVALAKTYDTDLGTFQNTVFLGSSFTAETIPDDSTTGVTKTITVTDDLTIELVQIQITIDHPAISDIGIELTSPSGTKSIILNIRSGLLTGVTDAIMASNAFYGETSAGVWTLKVLDSFAGNIGTLDAFEIKIFGH